MRNKEGGREEQQAKRERNNETGEKGSMGGGDRYSERDKEARERDSERRETAR